MPGRRSVSVPSYRLHKQSGQAVVTLRDPVSGRRKDVLLGAHGTPESRAEYVRVLGEWEVAGRRVLERPACPDITISELARAYWPHAEAHYRNLDGSPTKEVGEFKLAIRALVEGYGFTLASEFGPLKLKAVREAMIGTGLSRGTTNKRVWRIKKLFAWGVENELVPAAVWQGLLAVKGLQRGRSAARETHPVKPIPDDHVQAVLPFLSPPVAAMVRLQQLTGARPGEVCRMRACDIDTSEPLWVYRPAGHKNEWRGKDRAIVIGPQGKLLLKPFLSGEPDAYLFRPAESMAHVRAARRENRKTPVQPSQLSRRKKNPERTPGERYEVNSYAHAVVRACRRAGVPEWRPNRLRHTHATMVRKQFGLEAAQAAMGHSKMNTTEVYAEKNLELAAKVASAVG